MESSLTSILSRCTDKATPPFPCSHRGEGVCAQAWLVATVLTYCSICLNSRRRRRRRRRRHHHGSATKGPKTRRISFTVVAPRSTNNVFRQRTVEQTLRSGIRLCDGVASQNLALGKGLAGWIGSCLKYDVRMRRLRNIGQTLSWRHHNPRPVETVFLERFADLTLPACSHATFCRPLALAETCHSTKLAEIDCALTPLVPVIVLLDSFRHETMPLMYLYPFSTNNAETCRDFTSIFHSRSPACFSDTSCACEE